MQLESNIGEGMPIFGGRGSFSGRVAPGNMTPDIENGIFENPLAKPSERYTKDGRKIVDGVPETNLMPPDLWTSTVHGAIKRSMVDLTGVGDQTDRKIEAKTGSLVLAENRSFDDKQPAMLQKIVAIDKQIEENCKNHRTSNFYCTKRKEDPVLVVRRGQRFSLKIKFAEDFQFTSAKISVLFELGSLPIESQNSRVSIEWDLNKEKSDASGWSLHTKLAPENSVDMCVNIPATVPVGPWAIKLKIQNSHEGSEIVPITEMLKTSSSEDEISHECFPIAFMFLLCNPWNKDDPVFMDKHDDLCEYILEDTGIIWKGTHLAKQDIHWVYGQFEENVLENCMILLDMTGLAYGHRANPTMLCRAIAKIINSKDSPGVLAGNFTNLFSKGSHPTTLTGSAGILNDFLLNGRPVRYAQCWVFSALMCTVTRCLGIPCRVVTNYNSAHDIHGPGIHTHFSKLTGNIERKYSSDMVWNFHTWNECWMARPDLPLGFSGWQAVNATPQKKLEDYQIAGPAPVKAILDDKFDLKFGSDLFREEVTAMKHYWIFDENDSELVETEKSTGIQIVTRTPLSNSFSDITTTYKPTMDQAGSPIDAQKRPQNSLNRLMGRFTRRRTSESFPISSPEGHVHNCDIHTEIDLREASVLIGRESIVGLRLFNSGSKEHKITLTIRIGACLYTGAPGQNVLTAEETVTLGPAEEKYVKYALEPESYLEKMLDQAFFHVKLFGKIEDVDQYVTKMASFCFKMPQIEINAYKESVEVNEATKFELNLKNPLPFDLKECCFIVEGAGLTPVKIISVKDVEPNAAVRTEVSVFPSKSGKLTLVARFSSDKLIDVHGSGCVVVS